jgi:hypothetical protein
MNNLVQMPNVLTNQSLIALGIDGDDRDRPMEWMLGEMMSDNYPGIINAFAVLQRGGLIDRTEGGELFTELTIHDRGEFTRRRPDSFILVSNIRIDNGGSTLHFDAVVNKANNYWLLIGVSGAKVINLGGLQSTTDHLFTDDGRLRLRNTILSEYRGYDGITDYELGSAWRQINDDANGIANGILTPMILLPKLTIPSGRGKSVYDAFETVEDVMKVLKKDMPVRKDNVVLGKDMMTVQVIDLDNPDHVARYTRVPINEGNTPC